VLRQAAATAAAWTACTRTGRPGVRAFSAKASANQKASSLGWGPFVRFARKRKAPKIVAPVSRPAVVRASRPSPTAPDLELRGLLPCLSARFDEETPTLQRQAAAAATATTPQRAMLQGWRTPPTRSPGTPARPAMASTVDGSRCACSCGKDGHPRGSRKSTRTGTSGKPWIHLRTSDLPTSLIFQSADSAGSTRIVHRFSTE